MHNLINHKYLAVAPDFKLFICVCKSQNRKCVGKSQNTKQKVSVKSQNRKYVCKSQNSHIQTISERGRQRSFDIHRCICHFPFVIYPTKNIQTSAGDHPSNTGKCQTPHHWQAKIYFQQFLETPTDSGQWNSLPSSS